MKIKFLFVLFFIAKIILAQTNNDPYKFLPKYDPPKSPNASSFERYTSVPVNYQTGQVDYSIPLMNFTLDDLTVPLNLSYSNTGLKVSDVASWVGLGWNLNVGGAITRTVKGIPDDGTFGLMDPVYANNLERLKLDQMQGLERWNYFKKIAQQLADVEHDVFSYQVLGLSGSFYINKNAQCVQLRKTNNKIQFTKDSYNKINSFTIADEAGNKFIFNLKEESTIYTLTNSVTGNDDSYYNSLKGSTWYLTEVQTKNGQEIYFRYNHYQYKKKEKTQSQSLNTIAVGVVNCAGGGSVRSTYITTLVDVYQLYEIDWKDGFITFGASTSRDDLKQIDPNAAVPYLQSLDLCYTPTPFSRVGMKVVKSVSFEFQQTPRLFLKKVNFRNTLYSITESNYQFSYVNEDYSPWPSYDCTQQSYNAQDYWGYYNGAINNYELLPYDAISDYPPVDGTTQQSMYEITAYRGRNDRAANPLYASYGMLEQIVYPTGGKTIFRYEGNVVQKSKVLTDTPESGVLLNTLIQGSDAQNNALVTLGGIRVKKMEFYSNVNSSMPTTENNIVYDQANFTNKLIPFFITSIYRQVASDLSSQPTCVTCGNKYIFTLYSTSVVNNPAYIVEYNKVTEYNGAANNAGQTVHQYNSSAFAYASYWSAPYPTPLCFNWHARETGTLNQLPDGSNVSARYTSMGSNDVQISDYNAQLNYYDIDFKIQVIRNDPCYGGGLQSFGPDLSPSGDHEPDDAGADNSIGIVYSWSKVILYTESFIPTQMQEIDYGSNSQQLQKTLSSNYNLTQKNLLLPNSTSSANSEGEQIQTLITYPQDYFSGTPANTSDDAVNGMVNLINNNLLSIPVEQINTVNKNNIVYVTGASLSTFWKNRLSLFKTYKLSLDKPILLSSFTKSYIDANGKLIYDSHYQEEKTISSVDAYGQPLTFMEGMKGVVHELIWDYHSNYPVAELVNDNSPSLSNFAYTSFEADGTGNWSFSSAGVNTSLGITGTKSFTLSNTNTINKGGLTGGNYIVSYWINNSSGGTIAVNSVAGTAITTKNGWTLYQHTLNNITSVTISGTAVIDELRLYPVATQLTTYTYSPLIGITSQCDASDHITYYEYDGFGRLKLIRDQDNNIRKQFDYRYQAAP